MANGQPLRNYEHPYQISVQPYDPHATDEYVIGVNIEVAWHSAAVAARYADQPPPELDQDDMEEFFRQVCAAACVACGMDAYMKYRHTWTRLSARV